MTGECSARQAPRDNLARVRADDLGGIRVGLSDWPRRRWAVAAVVTGVAALGGGVPTDLVPTSLYIRMTPILWWNYPVWAISALLIGLTAATYVRSSGAATRRILGGGLLSFFAVGCPICNHLDVALLGVSGALSYFAPLQPVLALAGLALLTVTFALRLRSLAACPLAAKSRDQPLTATTPS